MSAGKILVVDDDPQIRRVMKATLVGHSYEVLEARSGEEALDLIDPGCRGGRVVDVPAWPLGEPVADQLGLVCAVVVHDDMGVETSRHVALDLVEELAELLGAVTRHAFADHSPGCDVKRGEQ